MGTEIDHLLEEQVKKWETSKERRKSKGASGNSAASGGKGNSLVTFKSCGILKID